MSTTHISTNEQAFTTSSTDSTLFFEVPYVNSPVTFDIRNVYWGLTKEQRYYLLGLGLEEAIKDLENDPTAKER